MNIPYKKINAAIAALFITACLSAQTPQMVKDINTTINGGFTGSDPDEGVIMGSNLYFVATDKANGKELWKTDGTSAGTVLVKDINAGINGSNPANLVVLGSNIYFSATNGVNGVELWKTDGTTAGTTMVQDINTGSPDSDPGALVALGGFVYFSAADNTHGNELWKTNGTTTSLVTDIRTGTASSNPSSLTVFGSTIVFGADDGTNGNELWTSNGTTSSLLKDIEPLAGGYSSSPALFCVNGSNIYFRATTSTYGTEPWISDGTTAGTHLLSDMNPGTAGVNLTDFRPLGANTLIAAVNGPISHEWYVTNGTTVTLVKDINPNPWYSGLSGQIGYELGGYIYFGANAGAGQGTELWRTDGTLAGTTMVKDLWPGGGDGYPYSFSKNNLNGFMYFCANNGTDGAELWKTDGTAAGTTQIQNINVGASDSYPYNFNLLGTQFIFSANDQPLLGANTELWKTDGTALGTTLVKNIYPDTVTTDNGFHEGIGVKNNTLYFSATEVSNGMELYVSTGTTAGTQLLKDINPGTGDSYPEIFTAVGSVTFFRANDGSHGTELWKTDGTAAGTVLVKDVYPGGNGDVNNFKVLGNFIYFKADDGVNGYEVWRSDGTAAGTTLVMDINVGGDSNPYFLAESGGFLYFGADDGINGIELWKTDGTTTTMVMDLNTVSGASYPDAEGTCVVGGFMYFTAYDGTDTQVWKTDGTTTTSLGLESGNQEFAVLNNKIYFSAVDAINGEELWFSDGTTTALVKDIETGNDDSSPYGFTASGNAVYFIAYNNASGEELWKTDGTAAGTVLVKDIAVGTNDSDIDHLIAFSGRVYFAADNTINGGELWQSDGTAAGTIMLEINPGNNGSYPDYFAAMNGSLYFGAYTTLNGFEFWKLTPSNLITTASVLSPTYCAGAAIAVPFTAYGTINAGNVYTAELSDATGSFASPVNVGTLTSTVLTGSIAATLPNTTAAGAAYRVRVKASNIATTGSDNGTDLTVNTSPVVTATAGSSTICVGNSVTLTAGGATSYTWSTSAHTTSIVVTPTVTTAYNVSGSNAAGCTNSVSVNVVVNTCVGIDEMTGQPAGISVYPNPANSLLNLDFTAFNNEEVLVEISNTIGQVVLSEKVSSQHTSFNIQHLNAGLYIIKTTANGKTNAIRFIKE
jgi:ELWxxDGT repeat protein